MSASLYGQPALYDLLFGGWSADLAHYAALAAEAGGPVLECAVGSGRLALHLARAGSEVHGFDRDPAMLAALAAHRAAAPPEVGARLTFERADLRTFRVERPYALVVAAFNALGHLHTEAELAAFLGQTRAALAPRGRFAFDVWVPSAATLAGRVSDSPRFRDPRTGEPVRCVERTWVDPATGLLHVELAVHDLDEGPPERLSLELRLRDAASLRRALEEAGFSVTDTRELGEIVAWVCVAAPSG